MWSSFFVLEWGRTKINFWTAGEAVGLPADRQDVTDDAVNELVKEKMRRNVSLILSLMGNLCK